MAKNQLYYGDNLDVLRRHIKDESVDLIYLDPPFNSNQSYNVLFRERNGSGSASQVKAFDDTWHWNAESVVACREMTETGPTQVQKAMKAFHDMLGGNDMLAYLAMMAPRLVELRRVLKPTGSIYLHCDPTASAHLRLLMDAVFGPEQFRNEIAWKRTPFAGSSKARARQYPRSHDVLLFYSKGEEWVWHGPTKPYSQKYLERFKWDDGDGRGPYRKTLLKTYSQATFEKLRADNRLIDPQRPGAKWSYKQYLSESSGTTQVDDTWADINAINPVAAERLGYPTQKPEALLERIIQASSNDDDTVLDPFCGCGTAVVAAHKLKRRWVGIDITFLAINLIKGRLADTFGDKVIEDGVTRPAVDYKVIGDPVSLPDAEELADQDPYQFQWWALGLVADRPAEGRKGADQGIDGRIYFHDEAEGGMTKQIMVQVKAGKTGPDHVRELRGVMEREQAEMGALITRREPTEAMRTEAATAGVYESVAWQRKYPRVQLLTVADLLAGKRIDYPPHTNVTLRKAPKARAKGGGQKPLMGT